MKTFKDYAKEDSTIPEPSIASKVPANPVFSVGDKVMCPGGTKGSIKALVIDQNTKAIKYLVTSDDNSVMTYPEADLTKVSDVVSPKDNIVPIGINKMENKQMKTFQEYILESLTDSDKKKIEEVGLATSEKIFGDKFDKEKAKKLIADLIEKNKDKEAKEISAIVQNAFTGKR